MLSRNTPAAAAFWPISSRRPNPGIAVAISPSASRRRALVKALSGVVMLRATRLPAIATPKNSGPSQYRAWITRWRLAT